MLAACQGSDSSADDAESDSDINSMGETTSTIDVPTSLTDEQEEFLENIAEADRYMETIRAYREALHDCTSDHLGCTYSFSDFLTDRATVGITSSVEEIIESGLHSDNKGDESFFVQRVLGVGGSSEVWICVVPKLTEFRVDEDGNRIDVKEVDERDELHIYEVVEQSDGELLINQVLVLDEEQDTRPADGTCDSYREWPPPLPQP